MIDTKKYLQAKREMLAEEERLLNECIRWARSKDKEGLALQLEHEKDQINKEFDQILEELG